MPDVAAHGCGCLRTVGKGRKDGFAWMRFRDIVVRIAVLCSAAIGCGLQEGHGTGRGGAARGRYLLLGGRLLLGKLRRFRPIMAYLFTISRHHASTGAVTVNVKRIAVRVLQVISVRERQTPPVLVS